MPRFVVLTHDHPELHWDFMLEQGTSLRTWRLSAEPNSGGAISAEPLPDHRLEYLDYEGPLSGDRGEVTQWDRGEYELIEESQSKLSLQLHGEKLNGRTTLQSDSENPNPQSSILNPQSSHCLTFSFVPE
jgi:hypothetical protein